MVQNNLLSSITFRNDFIHFFFDFDVILDEIFFDLFCKNSNYFLRMISLMLQSYESHSMNK